MDYQLLSNVVEELALLLIGARVERVYQGSGNGIYVLLHREKMKFNLLLSPDRTMPRLYLVSEKPAADITPHPFVLYLRSHLTGTRVVHVALLNQDRVVEVRFAKSGVEYLLVFELIGSLANLILTDPSSNILTVYYPVPLAENIVRPLVPGLRYNLPEKKAISLSEITIPCTGTISANKEAEALFQRLKEQKETSSLRQILLSCIRKGLLKIERRIEALSRDLRSTKQTEEYKQAGDVILANLDHLKTGMEQVDLLGYDDTIVAVRLDPKLSPIRNADKYFKKYKKAKAGHSIITQRCHQAENEMSYLSSLQASLEQAHDRGDLVDIQSALVAKGYLKAKGEEKAPGGPASPGYRVILFKGWEILVGKNAKGNDYMTTKIARPDDLWLHAEGMPGSHVLIKNPEKREFPVEVLVKGAALAAYYSKGKAAGKVSVTYTRAGLVKKPKGAKPGLAALSERKSIMVRPEEG